MRKILLLITSFILLTVLFLFLVLGFNNNSGKGALQITTNPPSKIYLDNKLLGQSPLCLCELPQMISAGDYTLKLEPLDSSIPPFQEKIKINPSVLTVVDRNFSSGGASGSIITLSETGEKNPGILIVSFPSTAEVYLDGNLLGQTPFSSGNVTASDHELKISKEGYKDKILKVRAVENYRIELVAYLSPGDSPADTSGNSSENISAKVTILDTPTGFLRVREGPSLSDKVVGEVKPGESFEIQKEEEGWYQIKLLDGKLGWISKDYAKKN